MTRYAPLLLILAVLFGATATAGAASAAPTVPTAPQGFQPTLRDADLELDEAEEEGDVEDFDFGDCDAEDFEFEDLAEEFEEEEELELTEECGDEDAKADVGSAFVEAPAACLIRRAESKVTTLPASNSLQLTVRYTTSSPTSVNVGLKLKDRKGSLALAQSTKRFGKRGVLQLTTKLGDATMDRVNSAGEFDISLLAPHTPAFCGDLLTQRLRRDKGRATGSSTAATSRVYRSPQK